MDLDLRTDCVDLNQGAQGRCALSLQHLLIQYGAPLEGAGTYGPRTAEAVRQFQLDHGLPATGATHSMTKEALYDNLGAKVFCPSPECGWYLGRTTTASIADALDRHPLLAQAATTAIPELACAQLKKEGFKVVCEEIVRPTIDFVIELFRQARDNNECVRVSFQHTTGGYKPIELTHTDGAHCPS